MYTGSLIDDLIASVERAEGHEEAQEVREPEFAYWHEAKTYEMQLTGQNLLGVA